MKLKDPGAFVDPRDYSKKFKRKGHDVLRIACKVGVGEDTWPYKLNDKYLGTDILVKTSPIAG